MRGESKVDHSIFVTLVVASGSAIARQQSSFRDVPRRFGRPSSASALGRFSMLGLMTVIGFLERAAIAGFRPVGE